MQYNSFNKSYRLSSTLLISSNLLDLINYKLTYIKICVFHLLYKFTV